MQQNVFAGPVAGASCCTVCCGGAAAILTVGGPAAFVGCYPSCILSMGTLLPCTFCAAAFLAPTP
ncbi:hypothetical protein I4U23_021887 [Adineta vaga]|nr:hypothetical protein I4U23_021887 [Adineta vaga]